MLSHPDSAEEGEVVGHGAIVKRSLITLTDMAMILVLQMKKIMHNRQIGFFRSEIAIK